MMACARDDDRPRPPKFPRRCWRPGQTERVERPEKGAGYDRRHQDREAEEEIDEGLADNDDNNKDQQGMSNNQ